MAPGELTKPEADANPGGWSQSKTVAIDYKGSPGTYLLKPNVDVTTSVSAITCSNVNDGAYTCDGTNIAVNGTLIANTWYKVESNPTLTFTSNGSVAYQVSDGTNYTNYEDGGSLTITEIDRTAPNVETSDIKFNSDNSITVTASGTDNESNIIGYQFSIDDGAWLPSIPQESNIYKFSDLKPGLTYKIKIRVINGTYTNNGINILNTTESATQDVVNPAHLVYNYDPANIVVPIITDNSFTVQKALTHSSQKVTYRLKLPNSGYSFDWQTTLGGDIGFSNDSGESGFSSNCHTGPNSFCKGTYTTTESGYLNISISYNNMTTTHYAHITNLTYNGEPVPIVFDYTIPTSSVSFRYGEACTYYQGSFTGCTVTSENGTTLTGNVYVLGGISQYPRQISINGGEWTNMFQHAYYYYQLPGLGTYKIRTRTAINGLYSAPTNEYTVTVIE